MNYLRSVWDAWKKFGQAIGDFVARIVLSLFYFTIFAPFGLIVRLFIDPLNMKGRHPKGWLDRTTRDREIDDARRLY